MRLTQKLRKVTNYPSYMIQYDKCSFPHVQHKMLSLHNCILDFSRNIENLNKIFSKTKINEKWDNSGKVLKIIVKALSDKNNIFSQTRRLNILTP